MTKISNIEAENVTNGGWGQSGRSEDSSDSSEDSSVDLVDSADPDEISEQQLLNSSDEESNHPVGKHSRSLTCPDIYSK